jgi:hypothetical protein
MRFREFAGDDAFDKFVLSLRTEIKSADGQELPLSWRAIANIAKSAGFEMMNDPRTAYEAFQQLWDNDQDARKKLETLVSDFNENQLTLNVPGTNDTGAQSTSVDDSEQAVDQMAASAAPAQIDQNQQMPQI